MKKRLVLPVLFVLLLLSAVVSGCDSVPAPASPSEFGIYLGDTGELVLSGEHVRAYYQDTHTLELNEAGIEKWNSYQTYNDIPKLKETLYSRDFIVKVDEEEIYRGELWSGASSTLIEGHVILESLFKLDEDRNTIWIEFGHLPSTIGETDMRNDERIIEAFNAAGKLK